MLAPDPRLPIVSEGIAYLQNLNLRLNDLFRKFAYEINNKSIFGTDGINYSKFEEDGTLIANGSATCFRDELNDLIKAATNNPSSKLVQDYVESCLTYKKDATAASYAVMNVQINHDWKAGSSVEPHIHWWQSEDKTPHWCIQYRWQSQCQAKTTAWTAQKWSVNSCPYVSGIINQITSFGTIAAPTGYGISDILQIRFIRDTANGLGLFTGSDPSTIDVSATSADVHIEIDMLGSHQLYVK